MTAPVPTQHTREPDGAAKRAGTDPARGAPHLARPRPFPPGSPAGVGLMLAIQRSVGNQAALQALSRPGLLQRKDPPDGPVAVAGPAAAPGPAQAAAADAAQDLPALIAALPDNQPIASPGWKASIYSYVSGAASLASSGASRLNRGFWDVTNYTYAKIWDTASGVLQGQMAGLGFELTDDQAKQLVAAATKQAVNLLVPVPDGQIIESIKVKKLQRDANPGTLVLEGISLSKVEWWLANLVTFQGPTLKIGSLGLDRINVDIPAKPDSAPGRNDGSPPLSLFASLKLGDLEIQGSGNILGLLADAAFTALPRGTPDRINRQESVKQIFIAKMQENVRESLAGSAKASLKSLEVVVHNLTFGDIRAAAKISGQNLEVGAESTGGLAHADVSADASGRLSVDEAFVQVAGKSALDVQKVAFTLDENGTGSVTAEAILHDKGLGKLADSALVRLFLNKSDPVKVTVPITAYKVMLGGLDFQVPKHPKAAAAAKALLDIRVTDKETQWLGLGRDKPIAPTLKVSVGKSNKASVTAPELGVSAEQQAAKPVLVPKGTAEGGSDGAVNIQAFVENVIQAKLRAASAQV